MIASTLAQRLPHRELSHLAPRLSPRLLRPCSTRLALILVAGAIVAAQAHAAPGVVDDHLKVDQFGYRPDAQKVAVISDPVIGYNAGDSFTPGVTYQVRRWSDDVSVFAGAVSQWRSGQVHGQSGDRVYRFDFSAVTQPGLYYLYDPANDVGSFPFMIGAEVYGSVLRDALRTYYYQRCGVAKAIPYAEADWADPQPCHIGPQQDLDCRSVLDPSPATSRDLSGGWHDAGDYNKYINFADEVLHALLSSCEEAPEAFSDDAGLPESGNGIPDLLDEVRYELDWFAKMQLADGRLLHKVSVTGFESASPPSDDDAPRRYAPPTASATISGCAAFAHGSIVFGKPGDPASQIYANQLEARAELAWSWLAAHPEQIPSSYDNAGFSNASAEDSAYEQMANLVVAAIYLYGRTGESVYRSYVDAHYSETHLMEWHYAYEFESQIQDAMLYYTILPGATASVVADILDAYADGSAAYVNDWDQEVDPYRAPLLDGHYVWGSNRVKAQKGSIYANRIVYGTDPASHQSCEEAMEGFLHYLHGVNPLAVVYLSNMNGRGAEQSVPQFYHGWFADGTVWDNVEEDPFGPAPGFVPGGPNPHYAPDGAYEGPPIEPPQNQPMQKSYRSWNTSWPENSWEVTENSITYQAAYIKLLSKFAGSSGTSHVPGFDPSDPGSGPRSNAWEREDPLRLSVHPNPSVDRTTILFEIPYEEDAIVRVLDAVGREVALLGTRQGSGRHELTLDTRSFTAGVYWLEIKSGARSSTRSFTVIR